MPIFKDSLVKPLIESACHICDSTFSCTFDEFKNDVTTLFLEEMCKEFVTNYEFVKVNEHKSHLLMNCTDLVKLGAEMESPFAKEWDKKNNCKDTVYSMKLVA